MCLASSGQRAWNPVLPLVCWRPPDFSLSPLNGPCCLGWRPVLPTLVAGPTSPVAGAILTGKQTSLTFTSL